MCLGKFLQHESENGPREAMGPGNLAHGRASHLGRRTTHDSVEGTALSRNISKSRKDKKKRKDSRMGTPNLSREFFKMCLLLSGLFLPQTLLFKKKPLC
jgi:hypothetical protein